MPPSGLPARLPASSYSRWVLTFSTTVCPARVRSLGLSKVAQLCGRPEKHWNAWGVSLFLPFEQKTGHCTLSPYIVKSGNAEKKKISFNFAQGMFTYYRKVSKYGTNWWQDVPIIILLGDKHSYVYAYILPHIYSEGKAFAPQWRSHMLQLPTDAARKKKRREGRKEDFLKRAREELDGSWKTKNGWNRSPRKENSICKGLRQKWGSDIWDEKRRLVWLELQNKGAGWASGDRQGSNYGAFGRTCYKDFGFYSGYDGKL